jgi:creatinine amidohydrolase/Fe(II)-dependent formamide hydrolase-like protein
VKIERAETIYPDPGSRYLTTDLIGSQAVRVYHDFGDLSPTGTLGDPSLASAEAGKVLFDGSVQALSEFIADFRGWSIPGGPK